MKQLLLFDGAFGTYAAALNLYSGYPELLSLENRAGVLDIHKRYIDSGANAIKTNTFAANSDHIADASLLRQVIAASYDIACQAASGRGVRVFADIGPSGSEEAGAEYAQLAQIFLELGADNFLFETQTEAAPLAAAIKLIKEQRPAATVIASFAVSPDGYSSSGQYYQDLFATAAELGADYVGMNCNCGPAHTLDLLKAVPQGRYQLIAMPNSGYPSLVNGRRYFLDNPEYFAAKLLDIYALGVRALGGCCGTTPEHIRCFAQLLQQSRPETVMTQPAAVSSGAPVSSGFAPNFIAVELSSPADTDTEFILSAARRVREAGGDFITIPDSPLGRVRASSMMTSALIQRQTGMQVIPHLCCRDKNQIAIKGELIGGNIEQISRVLAITGDADPEAERGGKNASGFNSLRLISFIHSLNQVMFRERPYQICAALNTSAKNFDFELKRAEDKLAAGAACLFTQPLFSPQNVENYRLAVQRLACPIAVGVLPLAGYKNALFLDNEVPGVDIPRELLTQLQGQTIEQGRRICLDFATGIIDQVRETAQGYYIMTPMKLIEHSLQLISYIKGTTAPGADK